MLGGPYVCYKCLRTHSVLTAAATTSFLSCFSSCRDSQSLLVFKSLLVPCLTGPISKAVAGEAPTPGEEAEAAVEVAEEAAVGDAGSSGGGTLSGELSA